MFDFYGFICDWFHSKNQNTVHIFCVLGFCFGIEPIKLYLTSAATLLPNFGHLRKRRVYNLCPAGEVEFRHCTRTEAYKRVIGTAAGIMRRVP